MIGRIVPLIHRLIGSSTRLLRGPYVPLVAVALALLMGFLALRERDARLRRSFELRQLKAETAQRVAELEARADAALRAANRENARLIHQLEARRRQLQGEAKALRERLAGLQAEERVQVEQVHALPPNSLARHIASRLDLDTRTPGSPGSGASRQSEVASPESSVSQPRTPDWRLPTAPVDFSLQLGTEELRKVETAFVQLDACREQSEVKDQQLANCREREATGAAMVNRMNDSLRQLNEAIRAKDEIAARLEAQHRAELKAARGSRWGRMLRAVKYVAFGVVIGVIAR